MTSVENHRVHPLPCFLTVPWAHSYASLKALRGKPRLAPMARDRAVRADLGTYAVPGSCFCRSSEDTAPAFPVGKAFSPARLTTHSTILLCVFPAPRRSAVPSRVTACSLCQNPSLCGPTALCLSLRLSVDTLRCFCLLVAE